MKGLTCIGVFMTSAGFLQGNGDETVVLYSTGATTDYLTIYNWAKNQGYDSYVEE